MRKTIQLATVLIALVGLAVPAAADHAIPVEGVWTARDAADGSRMVMTVREVDDDAGIIAINFVDLRTTQACDPPSIFVGRSVGENYDDGAGNPDGRQLLLAEFTRRNSRCLGRSDLAFDVIGVTWELQENGTLFDGTSTWRRLRG